MSKEEKIDISDAKFAHVMEADKVIENCKDEEEPDELDAAFAAGFKIGVAAMAGLGEVDIDDDFVQTLFITTMDLLSKRGEEE